MANEDDLWGSIVEVVEADNSTGVGIVSIMSKTNPIRVEGDRGTQSRPIITHFFPAGEFRGGTKDAMRFTSQFSIKVENDATGLAAKVGDRLEAVMTHTNLNSTARTTPVDVVPYLRARRGFSEQDEGRQTLVLEMEMWFNR